MAPAADGMTAGRAPRWSIAGVTAWLSVLSIVLPAAVLVLYGVAHHRSVEAEAGDRLVRTLDLLYEHGSKVFETYELLGAYVDQVVGDRDDDAVRADEAGVNERLARFTRSLPQVQDVWVIDAAGRPIVSANVHPVPTALDLSDRGYFRAVRDGGADVHVSETLRGRAQPDMRFFQYARRRPPGPDGRFNGVTAVSVEPAYFTDFYAKAVAAGLSSASLQRADGVFLARFPPLPDGEDLSAPSPSFRHALAAGPEGTVVRQTSPFDGIERLLVLRRLPKVPVYVLVSAEARLVGAAWREGMILPTAIASVVAFCLFALARLADGRLRRETTALAALRAETDRRERAEAQRRRADALYRAYFTNSPDILFVVGVEPGPTFTFLDGNAAHARATGGRWARPGERPASGAPRSARVGRRAVANYRRCLETGAPLRVDETMDYGQGPRRFETVLAPVHDDQTGHIVAIVGAARDVTERAEMEEALRRAQKMEAVAALTAGVAHDFNNILMVVSGSLEMIRRGREDRRERLIDNALEAVANGRNLTGQLLSFARRDGHEPRTVDVVDLVLRSRDMLSQTLRGIVDLVVEVPDAVRPVRIDPSQFQVALINLAANARDAMPAGGTFMVRVADAATEAPDGDAVETVRIEVSDTGCGMPADILARAFEPFFTTKPAGEGTGLGLAQVQSFAKRSGGRVEATSTPDRGTRFTLVLPRCDRVAAPMVPAPTTAAPVSGLRRILLVEDHDGVAAVATGLLEEMGYAVERVGDVARAEAVLRPGDGFDLVVTDLVMPGGRSGLDLARGLRRTRPGLPVLLVTGYSDVVAEALAEGYVVLRKPYGRAALADAIARATEGGDVAPGLAAAAS